jgi:hypothetical protein
VNRGYLGQEVKNPIRLVAWRGSDRRNQLRQELIILDSLRFDPDGLALKQQPATRVGTWVADSVTSLRRQSYATSEEEGFRSVEKGVVVQERTRIEAGILCGLKELVSLPKVRIGPWPLLA